MLTMSAQVNKSLVNFLLLTIIGAVVTLFLLQKTDEGLQEIETLTETPYYKSLKYLTEQDFSPANVSGTQTYQTRKFQFRVSYPDGWSVEERPGYVAFNDPKRLESGYKGDAGTITPLNDISRDDGIRSAFFVRQGDKYIAVGRLGAKGGPVIERTINGKYVLVGQLAVGVYGDKGYIGLADDFRAFVSDGKRHAIIDVIGSRSVLDGMIESFSFLE